MTTKVTNKSRVSSRRSQAELLEASTRTEDKDVRSFEVQTRHRSRAAGGGSDDPGSDARAPEFWIETGDAKQDLRRCQRDRGSRRKHQEFGQEVR